MKMISQMILRIFLVFVYIGAICGDDAIIESIQ